jgi:hypothetical protein
MAVRWPEGALDGERLSRRSGEQLRPWEGEGEEGTGRWRCSTQGEAPAVVVVDDDAAEQQIDSVAETGEDGSGASARGERVRVRE